MSELSNTGKHQNLRMSESFRTGKCQDLKMSEFYKPENVRILTCQNLSNQKMSELGSFKIVLYWKMSKTELVRIFKNRKMSESENFSIFFKTGRYHNLNLIKLEVPIIITQLYIKYKILCIRYYQRTFISIHSPVYPGLENSDSDIFRF